MSEVCGGGVYDEMICGAEAKARGEIWPDVLEEIEGTRVLEGLEHGDAASVGADDLELAVLESEAEDARVDVGSAQLGRVRQRRGGFREVEVEERLEGVVGGRSAASSTLALSRGCPGGACPAL